MPDVQLPDQPHQEAGIGQHQSIEHAYLERVREECRYLDSEGVDQRRAELNEVFVMLEAVPSRRRESVADVAPVAQRAEEIGLVGQLAERLGWKEPSRQAASSPPPPPPPPVPLSQALKEHQHLVILGEPGTGKSTLLQFVALCFASDGLVRERLNLDEARLPVRIALKTYDGIERLDRFIVQQLDKVYVPAEIGHAWLIQGRLAILLDGLDEVQEGQRSTVLTALQRFASTPEGTNSRIVLTSRIAGYSGTTNFGEYIIKPLTGTDDAKSYVATWLRSLQGTPPATAQTEAEALHAKLEQQPGLRRVLTNPLLLRLAVAVFVDTDQIAVNRVELYRRYVEEVVWRRAQNRTDCPWSQTEVEAALEVIAWTLHAKGSQTTSSLSKALESARPDIKDGAELFVYLQEPLGMLAVYGYDQGRLVGFRHLTFQEYFVARRLHRAWIEHPKQAWHFLKPRLHHPAWLEPILLLAGRLDQPHATQLVRHIWEKADSPDEQLLHRDMLLAASILGEGARVECCWAEMLIAHVLGLFADSDTKELSGIWPFRAVRRWWGRRMYRHERLGRFPSLQQRIDEVLVKVGLQWPQQVTAPLEHILSAPPNDTADDVEWRELPNRYWDTQDSDLRSRAAAILADVHRGDLLLQALATNDARVPAAWALLRLKLTDDEALAGIISLASSRDQHVRQAVAWLLSVDDGEAAIDALFRLADDEDDTVRQHAFVQLSQLRRPPLVPQVALLFFRALAAENAGDSGIPLANTIIEGLNNLLRVDGLPFTHMDAWRHLSSILHTREGPLWNEVRRLLEEGPRSEGAISNLADMVATSGRYHRSEETIEALLALLAIFGAVTTETLKQVMTTALTIWEARNWMPPTPKNTIIILAESCPDEVLAWLQQHKPTSILVQAVGALAQHGNTSAVQALLSLLNHHNPTIRLVGIDQIGWLEVTAEIASALRTCLSDTDEVVKEAALQALITFGDQSGETLSYLAEYGDEYRGQGWRRLQAQLFAKYGVAAPEVVRDLVESCVIGWDAYPDRKRDLIKTLHEKRPSEVESLLLSIVEPPTARVSVRHGLGSLGNRARAAEILGYLGLYSEEAEAVLVATLHQANGPQRSAAWALGRICKDEPSDTVVSALIETLSTQQRLLQLQLESPQPADEPDDVLMEHIIQALGSAGRDHPEAIALLTEFLEQGSKSRLRRAAAMALLQLGYHSPAVVSALPGLWKAKPQYRPIGYTYALAEEETEAAIWRLAQEQPGEFRTSLIEAHLAGSMQAAEILLDTMGTHLDLITLRDLATTLHGQLANEYDDWIGSHFVYTKLERVVALSTVAEVAALGDNPPLFATAADRRRHRTILLVLSAIVAAISSVTLSRLSSFLGKRYNLDTDTLGIAIVAIVFLLVLSAGIWITMHLDRLRS